MSNWYRWDDKALLLWVQVQPKASRNGFSGILEDAVKLRITAAPVDGKANSHLIAWLAKAFGVPKSAITIESGHNARRKRLRIESPTRVPCELVDNMGTPH